MISVLVYGATFSALRPLGIPALAVPIALCAATALFAGVIYLHWALVALAVVAMLYLLCSIERWLPSAWTELFQVDLAFQQAVPYLIAPILISSMIAFIASCRLFEFRIFLWLSIFLGIVVAPVTEYLLGFDQDMSYGPVANLETPRTFAYFAIMHLVLHSRVRWAPLIVCAVAISVSATLQSKLIFVFLLGVAYTNYGRGTLRFVTVGCFIAVIVSTLYVEELLQFDWEAGIRSMFWRDALQALVESSGIGVGFGTESIKVLFVHLGELASFRDPTDPSTIYISLHNAFLEVAFRMGVVPAVLFLWWVGSLVWAVPRAALPGERLDCAVAVMLILSMSVNVAVASFKFLFGTCWLVAWLVARHRRANVVVFGRGIDHRSVGFRASGDGPRPRGPGCRSGLLAGRGPDR